MRSILTGLLVAVFAVGGTAYAAGPQMELAQIHGFWARPPVPGQQPNDLFARWQRFDVSTRGNIRAGWFQAYNGAFGQNTLEIRDAMGRYTGEMEGFASRYEIRDGYGHTLGWFDLWGAFPREIRVEDERGWQVGVLMDVFGDGSLMRLRGDNDCIALFAKMGIPLQPGLSIAGRDTLRKEVFERLGQSEVGRQ